MSKSKVVTFKTITGLEIITTLVSISDNGDYVCRKPMSLNIVGYNQDGTAQLQLMPYFLLDPAEVVTFKAAGVGTSLVSVPAQFEQEYVRQTTGIELAMPGSSNILGI